MGKIPLTLETTYTDLPAGLFSICRPQVPIAPHTVIVNTTLSDTLGIDMTALDSALVFSGKRLPEGAAPISQAYAGHQYGHYRVLGDGRAHLLGEYLTPSGERFDIQLKGSGETPYSRGGDGKATLGSMLREYIISEAMHHLGIPTTRSLAVVTTGESIMRDTLLPGAVLTRLAASHIRVGTFQCAAYQHHGSTLASLVDYTIMRHYPHIMTESNRALALLEVVMNKQIDLIVHWMRVGFIHGVMNTDNMTVSGETIDYGPCAFMDTYHPDTVFSSIDRRGRYAYSNQSTMALWNLARFAETLLPVIDRDTKHATRAAEKLLDQFFVIYEHKWLEMMRAKLGLLDSQDDDKLLIDDLLQWMQTQGADYTNTFYDLSYGHTLSGDFYNTPDFTAWYERWQQRITSQESKATLDLMQQTNPVIIPRNHIVEQVLSAAGNGDITPSEKLLKALQSPYAYQEAYRSYQVPPNPMEQVQQTFCGT